MTDTETVTGKTRTAAVRFIFVTALMDVISLGIMIPVLPNLVKEFVGGDTATAAHWTGIFGMIWAFMQFVCSPIIGRLSDRFGRRPILLASVFGIGVDFLFMALAPTLALLLVGRVINGIMAASFSTANAYVADVTPPDERAKAFGMMGAAFGVGFIVGPALGGILGDIDLRLPFFVAAGMCLINFLYGWFVLPESLPPERRSKTFEWRKANPVTSLLSLRSKPGLLPLSAVYALFQLAHSVLPSIFVLYAGYRYDWSPTLVGFSMMATGVANVVVQTQLVGRAVKRFGERRTMLIGLACGAAGFAIYGLAATPLYYWLGLPVFALMGLTQPGLQGLMTRKVGPTEQGQLQGANASIMGLTSMIGPGLYTTVFAWSIRSGENADWPGLAIFIAAFLLLMAWLVGWRATRPALAVV